MLTRDDLAALLRSVNVEDVAREADVSTKTIYRMRHKKHSPTLDTAAAVVAAVARLKSKRKATQAA